MGSVLSFPILCLANLGVYLLATKELQQGWTDAQRLNHVLINGDDMVYSGPKELWEKHVDLGKRVGLEMSVGKAYVHDTYLNVNSISVHAPIAQPQVHPWRIDYLNAGLALGRHKIQSREMGVASEDDRKPEGYTCNINTVLEGCLPGRQVQMMKWILREKGEVMMQEAAGYASEILHTTIDGRQQSQYVNYDGLGLRNFFLPIQIGGMGILPPCGWKFKVTMYQSARSLEHLLQSSAKASLQRPLPGHELRPVDLDVNEPWVRTCADGKEPDGLQISLVGDEAISRRQICRRNLRILESYLKEGLSSDRRSDRKFVKNIPSIIRYDTSPNAWCR
jgi:hypothetical protein